jgi:hypothetical protein
MRFGTTPNRLTLALGLALGVALGLALALTAPRVAAGQEPTPVPAPPAAAPPPAPTAIPAAGAAAPLKLTDVPTIRVDRLPSENQFGVSAEAPAALPPKPPFNELRLEAPLFVAVRVDRTGKSTGSRRARDPIPSLAAEEKRSFERWTFEPARKGGQPVDTWATFRLDLTIELKAPKVEQAMLNPVTPTTSIPVPFEWGTDQAWYDALKPPAAAADGTVPVEQLDTLPVPKKTKWDADSFKGPFSVRMWVHVTAAGRADKTIPIQVSDPILIADIRRQIAAWQFRPARVSGQPADSWNELLVTGQIGWSSEIKQIQNLRKSLPEGK